MVSYFTRHPTASNLLMLLFFMLGISGLSSLQRETFPDFASQEIEVSFIYPGASASEVEEALCQRVEEAVESIDALEEVRCTAREGYSSTIIEMVEGGDISQFMNDVKSEIDAINDLPEAVEDAVIKERGRTAEVISIAITGKMSPVNLKAYAENIKSRLLQSPQITQVNLLGFSDRQLRIEIDDAMLKRYNINMNDIANTISRQNLDRPVGSLATSNREILLRFTEQRRSVDELKELRVISSLSGAEIRLGDIATIDDRFEQDEVKTLFNNQRAALLQVVKTRQQDSLEVMEAVKKIIAVETQRAPPGITFTYTQDRASIIEDRLSLLITNGIQGFALVFLFMWLFFQARFAFWVAMGLPVSFLGALYFMSLLGLTINMITMVALLMAIGLLMDDAIVISENIATHLRKGKKALDAAIDGTAQVLPGIISSFLTTVAVFAPLAFLSGQMGKVLQFIPMVLILVLAVSLVEAFFILPNHLAHSLKHAHSSNYRFRVWFDQKMESFRTHTLEHAVQFAVDKRYLFTGGVLALFIISIGMITSGQLKFQPFPSIEGDVIEARLLLTEGTPLKQTEATVDLILKALNEVDDHFSNIQTDNKRLIQNYQVRYNTNADAGVTGSHIATVTVDLLTAAERKGTIKDYNSLWRKLTGEIPDVISLNFKEPTRGPGGLALEFRLSGGNNLQELKQASLELQQWLNRYEGVYDVIDNLQPGKPEYTMSLREGTLALGLDATYIANQIRAAYQGTVIQDIQVSSDSFEIDVRLSQRSPLTIQDLESFEIVTSNGKRIPLDSVVEISEDRGFSKIERVNGVHTITVSGSIDTRLTNARQIVSHTNHNFLPQLAIKYPQIQSGIEGESKDSAKTGSSMLSGFGIGLFMVFLLLSFQFRSYSQPLVIMSIIPLAMIGVVWGHLLMGSDLTMPSMISFASLAGIVVNDSILLVEFLRIKLKEGLNAVQAAKEASLARFRAILITSLTTIAGLTPLLLEKSTQAQILTPLAISIIFGMLATTFLVLLVVPALFTILNDFGITPHLDDED